MPTTDEKNEKIKVVYQNTNMVASSMSETAFIKMVSEFRDRKDRKKYLDEYALPEAKIEEVLSALEAARL